MLLLFLRFLMLSTRKFKFFTDNIGLEAHRAGAKIRKKVELGPEQIILVSETLYTGSGLSRYLAGRIPGLSENRMYGP